MRRAVTLGDGWFPYLYSPERYAASVATIEALAAGDRSRPLEASAGTSGCSSTSTNDGDEAREQAARSMGATYSQDFGPLIDRVAAAGHRRRGHREALLGSSTPVLATSSSSRSPAPRARRRPSTACSLRSCPSCAAHADSRADRLGLRPTRLHHASRARAPASAPRQGLSVAQEAPDVRRLTGVLEAVRSDRDQAGPEGDRWLPALVDDLAELLGAQRDQVRMAAGTCRVEVLEQAPRCSRAGRRPRPLDGGRSPSSRDQARGRSAQPTAPSPRAAGAP